MEPTNNIAIIGELFGGPVGPFLLTGFGYLFQLAPIWLPILLIVAAWQLWMVYIRSEFIAGQEYVVLDIKLPEIIDKSPAAMEAVMVGLVMTAGVSSFIGRLWYGKGRPWRSFELVSVGGQIHFYVWTRKGIRQLVINQFYAHYPNLEISEVADYTSKVDFSLDTHNLWGADFVLAGGNPKPMKTYVDYGLDRDPKEEYKIDPINTLLEFLGSIGPREQVWIQFVMRAHKGGLRDPKSAFSKRDFKAEVRDAIKEIFSNPEMVDISEIDGQPKTTKKLSKGQIEEIAGIERKVGKFVFDMGIRGIYLAERDAFSGVNVSGLVGMFKIFSAAGYNGLKPTRWLSEYDYPWQDYNERWQNKDRYDVYDAYRRRAWFYPPYSLSYSIYSTEEIATMWHFPGAVAQTPSLPRIPSVRREPPSNLPV